MKKLINYLSKKSLSLGNGSGMTRFSLASLICLCMLIIGVGNVWGTTVSVVAGTYNKQANVEVTGNGSYIFMFGTSSDAYVMQNATSGSNYLGSSSQFTSLPSSITITTSPATNTSYFWSVTDYDSKTSTFKLCGPNGYCYCSASGKLKADQDNSSTWHIGTTSGVIYMIDGNSCYVKNTGASGFRAYSTTGNRTQLVAVYKLAPSCTPLTMSSVTAVPGSGQIALSWPAVSHADSYTVSCKVKSTGVAAGTGTGSGKTGTSCTITGLTNDTEYTWSVEPVGSGSYCSSNTPATGDAIPGTYYTVTWKASGSSDVTTSVRSGTKPTFPDTPTSCDGTSTTFYGWAAAGSTWSGKTDDISDKTIYTSASAMPNVTGAVTYHAVFAKATGSGTTTQAATIVYSPYSFSGTGWATTAAAGYSGDYLKFDTDGKNVTFTSPKGAISRFQFTYKLNSSTSCAGHDKTAWWIGDVKFYVSSDGGSNWSELSAKSINDINTGTGLGSDVAKDYDDLSSGGYNAIKVQLSKTCGNLGIKGLSATYANVTYSEYLTSCCTLLGSINGSVNVTQDGNSITVKDWTYTQGSGAAESNISTYDVYLYSDADSYAVPVTRTCSYNAKGTGVTFTGLSYARTYKFKIGATGNTNYCDITPVQVATINEVSTQTFQLACEDAELEYGTGSVTKTFGNDDFTNTLTNSHNVNVSYTVTSASPAGCVTVNSSGLVHIVSAGTATINATSTQQTVSSVKYCADNASYTLTVNKANISPSLSYSSTSLTTGDNSSSPTITGNTGSGTVSYAVTSATPAGCVTVDAGTGVVTAVAAGTATITATIGATTNYNGNTATANFTVTNPSYFPKGKTIFIQAHSTSAWTGDGCVMAWFHTSGGSETAQPTYWLFDATGDDSGKKLFATVAPATGDLPYLDIQRFAANCSTWWNKNGGCSYADASGSNAIRSTGKHDTDSDGDYVRWNDTGVTLDLHGNPSGDDWASSLASFSDQGAGVWTATYENYAPANAAGESQDFKAKTNYNGWIGNTGSNNNATLDGMHVGSTYNITATLDVTDHSLTMSKTFVKGTVHFDLQGHGLAISDLTNVTAGSKISAPSAPSATGYTFGGWYKEPACTNAWTFASDVVNETMTLYAKWTANVYTVTANLAGTSVNTAFPSSFTYTGSTTTDLNRTFSVNTTNYFMPSSVSVTMGGTPLTAGTDYTYNNSTGAFTFDRIITGDIVITATATAKLKSIAITTQPTTRKYFAGESFSSTGAVVTATMGDGSTKAVTASTTWTPSGALSAGTGQTVTASYTEGGINQTATTTIDVYSVTVNKENEDGDAIDVAGVTATWTVGTKALAAGVGSTKYAFKQWEVTGASIGSTTSASTTLSNPTANVVVNAVFWKPRTVKWSVNGNDSYNTGSPTTTVAYNGTISTIPTNPSGLVCASTFVAWTDAAHNNGTTAKASTSYYESKLFTAANQFPNITAETTTFYAVFAEGTGAAVNTVMWSEDWTGATTSDGSTGKDEAKPSAQGSHSGKTIYGGGSVTYEESSNATYVRNENTGGGTAPELMIKASEAFTISGIPSGGASELTLTYKRNNQALTPTVSGTDYSISYVSGSGKDTHTYTITCGSGTTFNLIFTAGSSNVRLDDVQVKVKTVNLTDYVTECDANIVSVTYDANGGATSCTNTTTDKTEDYTVCSTPPTRDYYTFAGWLCSADSKTYAANATIFAAAIDADFTLTAQWTPVPYSITYNYNGGSAQVDPAPATSYTVESSDITLQTPTKGHDRFDGWYENADLSTGGVKTTIAAGSHENKTYYAKWTARHEIIFDADGTKTTIYRAEDEALNASIAGQGSIPVNPSAPSACSSKVFVGWIAEEIEDETDDKPDFIDVSGTVDEDKHYYAVWAISTGTAIAEVEDESFTASGCETYMGSSYGMKEVGDYIIKNSIWTSSNMTNVKVRIKVKHVSNNAAETLRVSLVNSSGAEVDGVDLTTTVFGTSSTPAAYSSYVELTPTTSVTGYKVAVKTKGKSVYGTSVYAVTREVVPIRSAYSTSCCATKVTLSQNSPSNGTIAFGKTSVGTCGDQDVTLTITPAAGYQLHSYEVATGSGKVATKSVSPAISLDNNSSAVQNITLTFADEANGAYDVTASFSLMTVTSWAWTLNSAAIPDPLNLYVGQTARLDVAYTPEGVDASKKTYTRTKVDAYINWSPGAIQPNYNNIIGRASTGENTTPVTFTHGDGPTTTVNVKVLPLPLVHFADHVHNVVFADVVATLEANALVKDKNTPTSSDYSSTTYNTCEENHLHLVGWIEGSWADEHPNATHEQIAGAGTGVFYTAGASIDVDAQNGKTFYAVWATIE